MHKAANILDAIVAAVTGLATTGTSVEKTRGYPTSDAPAITVRMRSINPQQEVSNAILDSFVDIETISHVASSDGDLDDQMLQIDAETYAAIMADRTLGGVAVTVDPQTINFESDPSADIPTASGVRSWRIYMRHSITSTET